MNQLTQLTMDANKLSQLVTKHVQEMERLEAHWNAQIEDTKKKQKEDFIQYVTQFYQIQVGDKKASKQISNENSKPSTETKQSEPTSPTPGETFADSIRSSAKSLSKINSPLRKTLFRRKNASNTASFR